MIRKIVSIKNVGRFQNYSARNPGTHTEQLGKNVLIYGENGTGKSTLSLILSSLKQNNSHIKKRKSFGSTSDCNIELIIDGNGNGPTIFNGTSWNKVFKDIEVFDAHFISENIFTGHEILSDHEKNMFQLIVGERELDLKNQIAQAKSDIDDQTRQAGILKRQLEQKLGQKISVDAFIKLSCDESIEDKKGS